MLHLDKHFHNQDLNIVTTLKVREVKVKLRSKLADSLILMLRHD